MGIRFRLDTSTVIYIITLCITATLFWPLFKLLNNSGILIEHHVIGEVAKYVSWAGLITAIAFAVIFFATNQLV
ncbi:MAG: hypothetical protein ACTSUE_01855 [Promethearchaeota archaeon]